MQILEKLDNDTRNMVLSCPTTETS